jgi:hypothetical protein
MEIVFRARFKVEFLRVMALGSRVFELAADGHSLVYFPRRRSGRERRRRGRASCAPEILARLRAWCLHKALPLVVDDAANVTADCRDSHG